MPPTLAPSIRYSEALGWAAELHRRHPRDLRSGELLAPIARSMAVSVLVWSDGGDENQAIAALLLEAIAASAQTHRAIGERFGETVADLVVACRPFAPEPGACPDSLSGPFWVRASRARLQAIQGQPVAILRVITAQLAQEAWECWQACRRNTALWAHRPGGLEGTAWYWLRLHQLLRHSLPESLAIERLAEVLKRLLASPLYADLIPSGLAPSVWAARYDDRCLLAETLPDRPPQETARPRVLHQ